MNLTDAFEWLAALFPVFSSSAGWACSPPDLWFSVVPPCGREQAIRQNFD